MHLASPLQLLLFALSLTLMIHAIWRMYPQTASPTLDWLEATFIAVVAVVVVVGWFGVLLATVGYYSLNGLLIGTTTTAIGLQLFSRTQKKEPFSFQLLHWQEWGLLILLSITAVFYFQPHELIIGGADAGSYVNTAATVAQTGHYIVQDEWTQLLYDHAHITLRHQPPNRLTNTLQFVGWYIDDADPSRTIPQFFPFHTIWLTIGITLGGIKGGLLVTPLWGVLGITAVYLLGRHLFNRNVGLLAALLLALTPTHLYFARYPTTEPLTLLLIFTGLLCFHTFWQQDDAPTLWAIIGGGTFGVAFLTRIDLPVVAFLIFALLFIRWRQDTKAFNSAFSNWRLFTLTFSLFLSHALFSAIWLNWPYTWNTYSAVFQTLLGSWLQAGLLISLTIAGFIIITWQWQHFIRVATTIITYIGPQRCRRLAGIAVIMLSAYAYWLRPLLHPPIFYLNWLGSEVPLMDGLNWPRIGWYVTPLGLLLATLGFAWLLQHISWYQYSLFLSVGFLTVWQYVHRSFIPPYHIYMMRRYVPIVLPMLILMIAYFLLKLMQTEPKRLTKWASLLLTIIMIGGLLNQSRHLWPQRDGLGLVKQLTDLNQTLNPDAILIINDPVNALFADAIGVPLHHLFNHPIATIRNSDADLRPFLTDIYTYANQHNRPIQLLAINPLDDNVRQALNLQPQTMVPLQWQSLQSSFDTLPTQTQTTYYGIEIYDVVSQLATKASTDFTIDIGGVDSIFLQEGFYNKEPLPGPITMRWTKDKATLTMPWTEATTVVVTIQAMIFRPEGVSETAVTVWLDEQMIGTFTPTNSWQTITFTATAQPTNGRSQLRFTTGTFNPATLGISTDNRDLGFLLDWVQMSTPN